jgi:hypothetical protein
MSMLMTPQTAASLFVLASLVNACTPSQPAVAPPPDASKPAADAPASAAPADAPAGAPADASASAAPAVDPSRCTKEVLEPLKLELERSCSVRPEFRDDCLSLYAPLPVFGFDPQRAGDLEYCRLERPDDKTLILHHKRTDPGCARFAVKFTAIDTGWKLGSVDLDKTCT